MFVNLTQHNALDTLLNITFNPHQPMQHLLLVASAYPEFHSRFIYDIDSHSDWLQLLSVAHINKSNPCIHMLDNRGGFGNRIYRDPAAYFLAYTHQCTLSLHWGHCQNYTNYLHNLFVDSLELIASNWSIEYISYTNNHFIVPSPNTGNMYKRIHPKVTKILPYTDMYVEIHNESSYDENTIYEDYPLQPDDPQWFDADIDVKYGELRPWNGYTRWYPALRFYALLLQQLRMQYRLEMVQFLQQKFTNKFVVAIHLRTGIGESEFNRGAVVIQDVINQTRVAVQQIFDIREGLALHSRLKNKQIAFYLTGDFAPFIQQIVNRTLPIFDVFCQRFNDGRRCNDGVLNEEEDIFTRTKVQWAHDKQFSFGKSEQLNDCVQDAKDAYIDSELLAMSDALLLPYVSTYSKFSRAFMMKRKKIICHSVKQTKVRLHSWFCKDFESQKEIKFVNRMII